MGCGYGGEGACGWRVRRGVAEDDHGQFFFGRGVVREEGSEGRSGCGEESVRGSTSGALPLSPPARPTAEHHPSTHGIFLCGGVVGCLLSARPESIDWRILWKCGIVFLLDPEFALKCCSPTHYSCSTPTAHCLLMYLEQS